MSYPIQVVKMSAISVTSSEFQLTGFLAQAFRIIHFFHRLWYWFRRFELYKNPDNFLKLAAGHVFNWVLGEKTLVRIAAQSVLIGARILECAKEQKALIVDSKKFWNIITDKYRIAPRVKFEKFKDYSMFSLSLHYNFKVFILRIVKKGKEVCYCIFIIGKRLFILSMKTMDAATAFSYGSPHLNQESLNEFFINSSRCMEELVNNKTWLLNCLNKNKATVALILKNSLSIFTVDQLIHVVEKSIESVATVHKGIEKSSKAVGMVGRDLIKRATFGIFQAAGLTSLMPMSWVPSQDLPWLEKKNSKNYERFPPMKLMIKPSSWKMALETEVDSQFSVVKKQHLGHKILKASLLANLKKEYDILR